MTAAMVDQEVTSSSLLSATLARMTALDAYLAARVIRELSQEWFIATDLISDPRRLDEALQRIVLPYSPEDQQIAVQNRHIAASFLIHSYAWTLPAAAIGTYLSEQRVPDLDPTNVALRFGQRGEDDESRLKIAFLSEHMAVLPDDPATGQPDVIVLDDKVQLREWLRVRLETHMHPLIEAVYRRTHFGRRAQWNLVADDCASLFLWAGEKLHDRERACAEGLAFIGAPGSPMQHSKTGYFTLEYNGRCGTFRKRGGCCLYYKLPTGQHCSTCSLIAEEERDRRLLEYMVKESEQESTE